MTVLVLKTREQKLKPENRIHGPEYVNTGKKWDKHFNVADCEVDWKLAG